jgi:hypothetical protein
LDGWLLIVVSGGVVWLSIVVGSLAVLLLVSASAPPVPRSAAVVPAVIVALAVPVPAAVVCALESVPRVALLKVIGAPMIRLWFAVDTAALFESVRKLAVSVVGLPCSSVPTPGVWLITSRGAAVMFAVWPPMLSQPALPGPALQPHQFSVASIVPVVPGTL